MNTMVKTAVIPPLQGAPGAAAVREAAIGADEEVPAASSVGSNGWRLSPEGDAAILEGEPILVMRRPGLACSHRPGYSGRGWRCTGCSLLQARTG